MTDEPANDWEAPGEASRPTPQSEGGPPFGPNASLFEKGADVFKQLAKRSFENNIAVAYLVLLGLWTMAVLIISTGVGLALFASGLATSPNDTLDPTLVIGVLIGGGALFLLIIVAWQTLLIGLHRPLHHEMFRGPNSYGSVGAILRASIERFFPILGVSLVIGTIVYGGAAASAGIVVVESGALHGSWSLSVPLLAGLTGGWLLLSLVTGFFLGPSTYFVATRDIGVFSALGTSFNFVREHFTSLLAAWGIFVAASLAYGCVGTIGSLIPCLGIAIQFVLNAAGGFLGLLYWAGVFILLEDEFEPNRTIVW